MHHDNRIGKRAVVCYHKIARILRDKLRSRYRDIRARIKAQEVRHGVQMPQPEFRRLFLRLALSYEKLRRQQHHERVRNVRTEEIFKKAQQQYARCFQGIARLSGNERVQNGASGSDSGKYFKKHEQASRFELKNI